MADSISTLTTGIGRALAALEEVFSQTASLKSYLNLLGWEPPPGVEDIGLTGADFASCLEKLRALLEVAESGEDEILLAARAAELGQALGGLVADIRRIADALPARLSQHGDYFARTNIHKELPRRTFDLILIGYLTDRSPLAFSVLNLLNILEFKHFPADAAIFQVEHIRAIAHYDRIHALFSDPAAHLRDSYGWGKADFAALDLLSRIGQVLKLLGASTRLQPLDRRAEMAVTGRSAPEGEDASPQLIVHLFEELNPIAGARFGITAFGVRPTAPGAGDAGLGFLPVLQGRVDGAIPLHACDDTFLEFSGEADLLQRVALILRPDRPAEVRKPATLGDLAGGRFGLGIRRGSPGSEPMTLVRFPGGSELRIRQFSLKAGLEKPPGAAAESFLEMELAGCRLVLSLSGADGFVSTTVPEKSLEAGFDLGIKWSAKGGIAFRGGGGLKANLPVHRKVGPFLLQTLCLGVDIDSEGFRFETSASGSLTLGPLAITVDRLGLLTEVSFKEGNLGLFGLSPEFKPPNGLGLSIDATVVVGGGYIGFDPAKQEYSGILQLEIAERISVKALGLLATRLPDGSKGFSLVAILFTEGFTPIQLGFGFLLTGIGGLLAINRSFDENALRAGLKNHALDSVLFPKDPIRNAPQILSNINKLFPVSRGHHLFGPMLQIVWGTPPLITANLAVVLEFGARLRLLVLAQVAAVLPRPDNELLALRMDAVGILDFDQADASLDATLHDSRLLKKFVLTGDMAMRLKWRGSPNFALAVGGLHPAFNPPPAFPKLERIAINLSSGDNPRIRCEAYFAITSNTVQFGARAELFASAAGFSIQGAIGFDVLIQFDPFFFLAEFAAQVQLKRGSSNLFKVRVEGALSGPRPLHVKGKATFEILWWDVSIRIDKTLVSGEKPPAPAPVDVLPRLLEALAHPGNWEARLPPGSRDPVTLRAVNAGPGDVLLHPLGSLTVKQNVVPLNLDISRFGQATPAGFRRFAITRVEFGGRVQGPRPVKDFFAPAQFLDLSDEEKLSRPSFESMAAGESIAAEDFAFPADPDDSLETGGILYETILFNQPVNPSGPIPPAPVRTLYTLGAAQLERQARFGAAANSVLRREGAARFRTATGKYAVAAEGWSIVSGDDLSVQGVPGAPGQAVGKPSNYSEAEETLRKLAGMNPAAAGFKIVRLSEVTGA